MNFFIFVIILFYSKFAFSQTKCLESEVYVSSHSVKGYQKLNGTKVKSYYRNEYCRKSPFKYNGFQFKEKFSSIELVSGNFKEWSDNEIKFFLNLGEKLPEFLKAIEFEIVLHSKNANDPNNPATAIPDKKALILYDLFFKRKDALTVLGHELAHFLYWKLNDEKKIEFAILSGWKIKNGRVFSKPADPIYDDSLDGPSEDFANNVEAFYFDKVKLKKNNPALIDFFTKLEKEMK